MMVVTKPTYLHPIANSRHPTTPTKFGDLDVNVKATVVRKTPAEVSRVAVRLPPFYSEEPEVWFASAEAQFTLAGITEEKTKFYYVLSQLDYRYVKEVRDLVISPPHQDPYTKLKTEMLNRLSPSREKRTRQLLTCEEMGERKPSQFLRHLRNLDSDVPDRLLRIIWTSRLPSNVQVALAGMPEIELDTAALCADRIFEAIFPAALAPATDNTEVLNRIEELSREVEKLSASQSNCRHWDHRTGSRNTSYNTRDRRSNSRNHRRGNRSHSRDGTTTTICWYHSRFGANAKKCSHRCTYNKKGN
jgi:hypothetical protein